MSTNEVSADKNLVKKRTKMFQRCFDEFMQSNLFTGFNRIYYRRRRTLYNSQLRLGTIKHGFPLIYILNYKKGNSVFGAKISK